MAIRYLVVRPSGHTPRMSRNKATHITALINRTPNWKSLKFTATEVLGIIFEQAVLADYMLGANPENRPLQDYRENCKESLRQNLASPLFKKENLDKEYVPEIDVQLISDYVFQNQHIGASGLESILQKYTGTGNKFTSAPANFLYPYLEFRTGMMKEDYQYNPVVLSPVQRIDPETNDAEITFYCRPYTSINVGPSGISKDQMANRTFAYICSMNHNGRSWKDLIDTIQSLHLAHGTVVGTESLASMLNSYLRADVLPSLITGKEGKRRQLLDALRIVMERDALSIDNEPGDVEELATLFAYLGDNRLMYLTKKDPMVAAQESWMAQTDLAFLDKLAASHGYAMAADDGTGDGADDGGNADDGEGGDDATDSTDDITDGTEDGEGGDEGDDLFGDGDDFAEDGDDGGDDSGGGDGGGSSDSSSSTSTSDSGSSDGNADPEDVNPVIEIIEDETFDEYLDRGILQVRIKRMITNPPASLSSSDVEFLKYWYLVWFPCVSVATTREILGKILVLPAKKISSAKRK